MISGLKERNCKDYPTMEEKLKYSFICAASLLGIMGRCYYCKHLRTAIKKLDERKTREHGNKMD